MLKVAINGYGRIGRIVHRQLAQRFGMDAQVVAINASSDAAMRQYLLTYDTLHGRFEGTVEVDGENLKVNGSPVRVIRERDPAKCPWKELGVDVVVEATGKFRSKELCKPHLAAGAKAVIITAPAKDDTTMIVRGVNDDAVKGSLPVISAASCTTNCVAPVIKVIDEAFGIERGLVCTTHAYTTSQNLLDNTTDSSKIRIARAAALSIIPSTTGAVKACAKIFPHLKGKIDGMALRVPVPTVSAAYMSITVKKKTMVDKVHEVLTKASNGSLKGILGMEKEQLVSADFVTDPRSSIIDMDSTVVIDDTLLQILSWYDNEWGYAMRVTELVVNMGKML